MLTRIASRALAASLSLSLTACLTSSEEYQAMYAYAHDRDADGVWGPQAEGPDCDDADPRAFPGADEHCNGKDDDCDGAIDEAAVDTWVVWVDADGDGFGEDGSWALMCERPEGWAWEAGDCDDGDAAVNPDAVEICDNGVDDDCDGGRGACRFSGEHTLGASGALLLGVEEDAYTSAVDVLEDFGGDGVADVVVGAWGVDGERGQAYVVRGPVSGELYLDEADLILTGSDGGDRLGDSVSSLGDLDGRGLTAFAVTAPGEDSYATDAGAVYIFTGGMQGRPLPEDAQLTLYGTTPAGGADARAWGFGDLTGDGEVDVLIGMSTETQDQVANAGALYLLPGSSRRELELNDQVLLMSFDEAGFLGRSAAAFDSDGDGIPDLAVSALGAENDGVEIAGWVGVMQGPLVSALHSDDAFQVARGSAQSDAVGLDLHAKPGGDLDQDGYDDLLVGSLAYTRDFAAGRVSLLLGGRPFNGELEDMQTIVVGDSFGQRIGEKILALDEDNDGVLDLLLGAPLTYVHDDAQTGAVYLVHGPFEGTREVSAASTMFIPPLTEQNIGSGLSVLDSQDGWGGLHLVMEASGFAEDWGGQGAVYVERSPSF